LTRWSWHRQLANSTSLLENSARLQHNISSSRPLYDQTRNQQGAYVRQPYVDNVSGAASAFDQTCDPQKLSQLSSATCNACMHACLQRGEAAQSLQLAKQSHHFVLRGRSPLFGRPSSHTPCFARKYNILHSRRQWVACRLSAPLSEVVAYWNSSCAACMGRCALKATIFCKLSGVSLAALF